MSALSLLLDPRQVSPEEQARSDADCASRRSAVKDAMLHAYRHLALGADEVNPVTGDSSSTWGSTWLFYRIPCWQ